ncbi:hypothetical protein [Natranaerobius thermophilus]|uniref:Uncharacterized protein n=1 Tax=Natranaerobius thermophilus (strain ATCC BAA-1301 / DSM 18059 / JW/NM-WN-LF) TaxID=457570 RepID=B2A5E1_NATTJ|nr:hypothetical protein [Natranaerobius thermophilus]ACB83975.1 hypothetical protein Nther_0379 [Natranaerobius thermophilus JW/NM-WN-LF]
MLNRIRKVQDDLSAIQVELAKASEEHELELLEEVETGDSTVKLEKNQNGVKLTVDVVAPKISIYKFQTFENGNFTNRQHKEVRDYWYSIIKRALAGQNLDPIKPAIVYIRYYLDKNCDVGNFLSKFIQDGLVYNGVLEDDDLNNVTLLSEAKLKKEKAPRTEIYVVHDNGKVGDMITSQFK